LHGVLKIGFDTFKINILFLALHQHWNAMSLQWGISHQIYQLILLCTTFGPKYVQFLRGQIKCHYFLHCVSLAKDGKDLVDGSQDWVYCKFHLLEL
jgi:hypothetical protein